MRHFILLILLFVFVVSTRNNDEAKERKREKLRSIFKKVLAQCILKSEASAELKKEVEENKDGDLKKVLHNYVTKIDSNDREIIRKCRRKSLVFMKEKLPERLRKRQNITDINRVSEKLPKKNLK